ncbi:MAG TPA: histidine phosphatase family protein [Ktedonobacterales bacterium]|nr:histidine phosphatase family protein [Ktedonobacterales bacterium]
MEPLQQTAQPSPNGATAPTPVDGAPPDRPPKPPRVLILVRHGEATFNVEKRLPGQLDGIPLTEEGRRQAYRAAVALSALPIGAVISSPLERAHETATIIARGFGLPVREDARLKDLDVGPWSGKSIDELNKTDPHWKAFVEHPSEPPEGVEGFPSVQARAVAAIEDVRRDESLGSYVVLVAHADVIKLILAHYTAMTTDCARLIAIGNAAISALAFGDEPTPHLLAVNWTAFPGWLFPQPHQPPQQAAEKATETHGGIPAETEPPADAGAPLGERRD